MRNPNRLIFRILERLEDSGVSLRRSKGYKNFASARKYQVRACGTNHLKSTKSIRFHSVDGEYQSDMTIPLFSQRKDYWLAHVNYEWEPSMSRSKDLAGFEVKDIFLAPWGLASEERPMHIMWEGKIESIEIDFEDSLDVSEIFNVQPHDDDYSTGPCSISIPKEELVSRGYLGLIFSQSNTFEDAVVPHNVDITFHLPEGKQYTSNSITHTIRPQIEEINHPEEIVLSDEDNVDEIELKMRYVGFGQAKVAVRAQAEGEVISEGESLSHDLLRGLLETGVHKQDVEGLGEIPAEWKHEDGPRVPQEEIDELVEEMREVAQSGSFNEEYGADEVEVLADAVKEADEASESSGVAGNIYRYIENTLLSSILNVVDRHPTENVSLNSPTTKIQTEAKATEIVILVHLRDNKDNQYEPTEISIDVIDERSEGGIFEADIVTEWENYQVDPNEVFSV